MTTHLIKCPMQKIDLSSCFIPRLGHFVPIFSQFVPDPPVNSCPTNYETHGKLHLIFATKEQLTLFSKAK